MGLGADFWGWRKMHLDHFSWFEWDRGYNRFVFRLTAVRLNWRPVRRRLVQQDLRQQLKE